MHLWHTCQTISFYQHTTRCRDTAPTSNSNVNTSREDGPRLRKSRHSRRQSPKANNKLSSRYTCRNKSSSIQVNTSASADLPHPRRGVFEPQRTCNALRVALRDQRGRLRAADRLIGMGILSFWSTITARHTPIPPPGAAKQKRTKQTNKQTHRQRNKQRNKETNKQTNKLYLRYASNTPQQAAETASTQSHSTPPPLPGATHRLETYEAVYDAVVRVSKLPGNQSNESLGSTNKRKQIDKHAQA